MIIDEVYKCSICKQEAEILEFDDYSFCLVCPKGCGGLILSVVPRDAVDKFTRCFLLSVSVR